MKRFLTVSTALICAMLTSFPAYAAITHAENADSKTQQALILLAVISAAMVIFSIIFTICTVISKKKKRRRDAGQTFFLVVLYLATLVVIGFSAFSYMRYEAIPTPPASASTPTVPNTTQIETTQPLPSDTIGETTAPTQPDIPALSPHKTASSDPSNWGIKWEIIQNGAIVNSYERTEPISFGKPEEYTAFPGISTFRGNNYRNNPVYGSADIKEGKLESIWKQSLSTLNGWPGAGWTGQPLIAQWDQETKNIMNLYDSKKAKENLVEVIYATLDGKVYFYDLEDGSYTRDPVNLGMNFKGSGTLDPRGYPILYVGSGDYVGDKAPRMYIVSLIDGKILYEKSGNDSFIQRGWVAFDSAPLVHGATDTLIWPGESGILYTIKLNSQFDKKAGTLSLAPEEIVKTRYTTSRYSQDNYWIGYEPGAVIVDHYLYISENGGMFFCIDLNTMELIWAQDTKDDSNSTPVFEWSEDGSGYLYTAPSLHWTASNFANYHLPPTPEVPETTPDGNAVPVPTRPPVGTGSISIYKLDAETGEILWEVSFECSTVVGVSGGVQSSPLLGKKGTELEGLIIYTISRTPTVDGGKLVAFDTETGKIVWEDPMVNYAWSSPIAIYGEDGKAHIVVCDSGGNMSLYNAQGKEINNINLGSNIEATPTAFNDTVIIGTRGQRVYGIKVK